MEYPHGGGWREVQPLPSPREEVRAATLLGALLLTGGYTGVHPTTEVLRWQEEEEVRCRVHGGVQVWRSAGDLGPPRASHATTPLPLSLLADHCYVLHSP